MELEEPITKKLKQGICIICNKNAKLTDKSEVFTNLLIKYLLNSLERDCAVVEVFDFCSDCIEFMEEFLQLQIGLEFILKNISQKKKEIRIKILKNQSNKDILDNPDANIKNFRKICTREFCPTVRISRNEQICSMAKARLEAENFSYVDVSQDRNMKERERSTYSETNSIADDCSEITLNSLLNPRKGEEVHSQQNSILKSLLRTTTTEVNQSLSLESLLGLRKSPSLQAPLLQSALAISNPDPDELRRQFLEYPKSNFQDQTQTVNSQSATEMISQQVPIITYVILNPNQIIYEDKQQQQTLNPTKITNQQPPIRKSLLKSNFEKEKCTRDKQSDKNINPQTSTVVEVERDLHISEIAEESEPWIALSDENEGNSSNNEILPDVCEDRNVTQHLQNPNITKYTAEKRFSKNQLLEFTDCNGKVWPRPKLSFTQLCILAIMTSEYFQLKVKDIYDFIWENFPYYQTNLKWKNSVRHTIVKSPCFKSLKPIIKPFQKGKMYTINDSASQFARTRLICKNQLTDDVMESMAHPEHLPTLRNAVMRDVPKQIQLIEIHTIEDEEDSDLRDDCGRELVMEDVELFQSTDSVDYTESVEYSEAQDLKVEHHIWPANTDENVEEDNFATSVTTTSSHYTKEEDSSDVKISSNSANNNTKNDPSQVCMYVCPKSPLEYQHFCILAIMTSISMTVTISGVHSFMTENFPFYKMGMQPSCKSIIETVLTKSIFTFFNYAKKPALDGIKPLERPCLERTYTITSENLPMELRKAIAALLASEENLASMTYPDRVQSFITAILVRQCRNLRMNKVPLYNFYPSIIN